MPMYNVCTCIYTVCTCTYNVCTWYYHVHSQESMQWQMQQWYMHTIRGTHVQCMYLYIHCMYTYMHVHTCFNQVSQQQILVGILEVYPCMYKMVDSCMIAWYIPMSKAVQESIQWQIQQWYMHTIRGTHVQCVYMYIHCMYTYMQCTYMS